MPNLFWTSCTWQENSPTPEEELMKGGCALSQSVIKHYISLFMIDVRDAGQHAFTWKGLSSCLISGCDI